FSRRVSGLSVRNSNPPAFSGWLLSLFFILFFILLLMPAGKKGMARGQEIPLLQQMAGMRIRRYLI
ncbi:MAG: hypothetical protein ACU84H_16220, partial [Gammaproteobacteria bacterium]